MLDSLRYVCLFLVAWMSVGSVTTVRADEKPNILLLFTDDQCFDTIAALGHDEVITPNLDTLARSGVAFDNAYNMGGWNGAICIASRTMMNTGRFLWRAHAIERNLAEEAQQGRMLSLLLRDAGYETYFSGKWHVKIDANKIFDHVEHVRPGMPRDTPASYSRPNDKGDWTPWDKNQGEGGFWAGGKHWSEVLADDAVGFIDHAAESDKPFFMYLAFNAPHDPRQSPREYVEMYDREQLAVPDNFLPQYPHMNAMGAGKKLRDEKLAPWPRTPEAVQLHRQEYFALITHLDAQIGRILEHLDETGMRENTYIVMTADHGLACGQHGLLGKQSMYEHSMKAPLMVVGPGIPAGQRLPMPVYVQDFGATALEWAGVEKPEYYEFKSLLPLIRGERVVQHAPIYGAYEMSKQRMIRDGNLKLIHYPASDTYRLFDVVQDPHEMADLAGQPAYADKVAELKVQLGELMAAMDDPMIQSK